MFKLQTSFDDFCEYLKLQILILIFILEKSLR